MATSTWKYTATIRYPGDMPGSHEYTMVVERLPADVDQERAKQLLSGMVSRRGQIIAEMIEMEHV